jgi:hypothetical protein
MRGAPSLTGVFTENREKLKIPLSSFKESNKKGLKVWMKS